MICSFSADICFLWSLKWPLCLNEKPSLFSSPLVYFFTYFFLLLPSCFTLCSFAVLRVYMIHDARRFHVWSIFYPFQCDAGPIPSSAVRYALVSPSPGDGRRWRGGLSRPVMPSPGEHQPVNIKWPQERSSNCKLSTCSNFLPDDSHHLTEALPVHSRINAGS